MPGAYFENGRCYTQVLQRTTERLRAARNQAGERLTASSEAAPGTVAIATRNGIH